MKKILMITALLGAVMLTGCGKYEIPKYVEIKPNESAYVIPLEGATKTKQSKFDSTDFLEKNKVASKRIYITQKTISTGRMWWSYNWIPTVRVITVNRAPITLTWEGKGQGIDVESKDSIGFSVGINISAYVAEDDTSKFLYHYPSGNLKYILGNIIKSKATEILSREFAKYDLEGSPKTPGARQQKGEIVELAKAELAKFFSESGVTISTFGLIGGLAYDDKEIQEAINDNFKSELEIKNQENIRLAQEETNKNNIAIATADRKAAQQFAKAAEDRKKQVDLEIEKMNAEARLAWAKQWDGKLPSQMLPDSSQMLMQLK